MDIIPGDLHDPLTATYQSLELARLNDVLRSCGIDDASARREICEQYLFASGQFIDAGWFEERGRRFRPGIYFEELRAATEEAGPILLPDPSFGTALHEYAHGAAAWLFDDHAEDASEIRTGDINVPDDDGQA